MCFFDFTIACMDRGATGRAFMAENGIRANDPGGPRGALHIEATGSRQLTTPIIKTLALSEEKHVAVCAHTSRM